MPIWSSSTILRFTGEAERVISKEMKCLIARTALDIVEGTPTYELPSDLLFIRRVTWLGKRLLPMPARTFHQLNVVTPESEPLFYVFNQMGKQTIRLHPVPNQTIATTSTGLFGANIGLKCIVEYYKLASPYTTGLPDYIRRRLVKYYVMTKCFSIEGKGQNLKAAAKTAQRYAFYLNRFKKIYGKHFIAVMNTLGQGNKRGILAPPRLPYTFGEPGEF